MVTRHSGPLPLIFGNFPNFQLSPLKTIQFTISLFNSFQKQFIKFNKERCSSIVFIENCNFNWGPTLQDVRKYHEVATWVAQEILPFEPLVRLWLARAGANPADADDLIQEAYCKIMDAFPTTQIDRPPAFFFQITRNLFRNQRHRNRIIRIESGVDFEQLLLIDDAPSAENMIADRQEFARLRALIATMPHRCRQIFEMRKIEGLSQKEIAARLNISENIVENDSVKAIRFLVSALRDQGSQFAQNYEAKRQARAGAK